MNYDSLIYDAEAREYWQRRAQHEETLMRQAMQDERSQALRSALIKIQMLVVNQPNVDHTRAMSDIAYAALVADDELWEVG